MKSLSKKSQYALRALYALAAHYGKPPVSLAQLAAAESIPPDELAEILNTLRSQGIVNRAPGRGFSLATPPGRVTIGAVIRLVEGSLAVLPCAKETHPHRCEECRDLAYCGTQDVMRQVREAAAAVLDNTTLAQICAQVEAVRARF